MAEPKRARALLAIVALLQGMTGVRTWDDVTFEYPNPPRVELEYRDPTTVNYFPWFSVTGGFGSRLVGEGRQTVGTQIQIPDEFHVLVTGAFHRTQAPDVAPEIWLQRGYEDFRRTMFSNTTLGGMVRELAFGEYRPDAGMLSEHHLAEFEQELIVVIDDRFVVG